VRFEVTWSAEEAELEGDVVALDRARGLTVDDVEALSAEAPAEATLTTSRGGLGKGASGTGVSLVLEIAEHAVNDVASLIGIGYALRALISKISDRRDRHPGGANDATLTALAAAETAAIADAADDWYHTRTVPLTTSGESGTDLRDVWASTFLSESRGVIEIVFLSPTTRHLGTATVAAEWFSHGDGGHLRTDAELAEALAIGLTR
jgi:hypothetical protein